MLTQEKKNLMEFYMNRYFPTAPNDGIFDKTVAEYERQKAPLLKPLFGDSLIIEKSVEVKEPEGVRRARVAENGIVEEVRSALMNTVIKTETPSAEIDRMDFWDKRARVREISTKDLIAIDELASSTIIANNKLLYPVETKILGGGKKFQEGQKLTRVLGKIIDDKEVVNTLQVKISQITNTKLLKGDLCLSIDPMDYFTVSHNNDGWSSCFGEYGEFRASVLALLNSPNTFVAYLKSSKELQLSSGEKWNSKKWRVLVSLSDDLETIHVGKAYPYQSPELVDEVVKMVAEMTGKLYLNVDRETDEAKNVSITTVESMYNDAYRPLDVFKTPEKIESDTFDTIKISEGGICFDCGGLLFDCASGEVRCLDCFGNYVWCDGCGEGTDEDGGVYDADGYWRCYSCIEYEFSYCDYCGEYYHTDNVYHNSVNSESACTHCIGIKRNKIDVCADCRELRDKQDMVYPVVKKTIFCSTETYLENTPLCKCCMEEHASFSGLGIA